MRWLPDSLTRKTTVHGQASHADTPFGYYVRSPTPTENAPLARKQVKNMIYAVGRNVLRPYLRQFADRFPLIEELLREALLTFVHGFELMFPSPPDNN